MPHGKPVKLDFAQTSIQQFIAQEIGRTSQQENQVVVGHRFDLALLKEFMLEVDKQISKGVEIDSIRFYHGLNVRSGGTTPEYDLIIVPTLKNGKDCEEVYQKIDEISPLILGESTPCPNVCQTGTKTINCISEST
ncbi:hypothetical protein [Algoriphagus aquimarinus]|uniref:Uncharacterized protein n=1 Tax=Algoriphagus aquimarinus TaxID=237018 RepID=A0A1I1BL82_9BACT|nr:hypothetical protein [Algoriphagus aquimarinus]SFB50582.1 hypothetical protein SAMN04489723_11483 [Algoriphagus aquimarinus]